MSQSEPKLLSLIPHSRRVPEAQKDRLGVRPSDLSSHLNLSSPGRGQLITSTSSLAARHKPNAKPRSLVPLPRLLQSIEVSLSGAEIGTRLRLLDWNLTAPCSTRRERVALPTKFTASVLVLWKCGQKRRAKRPSSTLPPATAKFR